MIYERMRALQSTCLVATRYYQPGLIDPPSEWSRGERAQMK